MRLARGRKKSTNVLENMSSHRAVRDENFSRQLAKGPHTSTSTVVLAVRLFAIQMKLSMEAHWLRSNARAIPVLGFLKFT